MDSMKITEEMLEDEVVQFISQRHHATVKEVLSCFMMQADKEYQASNQHPVDLEENEVEIIHDLIQLYHQNK